MVGRLPLFFAASVCLLPFWVVVTVAAACCDAPHSNRCALRWWVGQGYACLLQPIDLHGRRLLLHGVNN